MIITKQGKVLATEVDTKGYQKLANSEGVFTADLALEDGTYNIKVKLGAGEAADITSGALTTSVTLQDVIDAWNTDLTGGTVALVNGKIKFTNDTEGASSTIVLAPGDANDAIAAFDLIEGVTCEVLDAVDGVEGAKQMDIAASDAWLSKPTRDFNFTCQVVDSSNKVKTNGLKVWYDEQTGYVNIADDGSTSEILENDVITVLGVFV